MSSLHLNENLSAQKSYRGELEFIIKDKAGRIVERRTEPNIIKIFAKEIISHRITHSNVWDPNALSGAGDWVSSGINIDDYSPKYIVFGASFDANNVPLDVEDTRFYVNDVIMGGYLPIQLGSGAEYDGGLINAIPIAEPLRPLKRVERVFFEPSYQPAGTPLLQADVRAINNIVVFETVLRREEYNGFNTTEANYFTITEVALVGAPEIGSIGSCECDPRSHFLTGYEGTDGKHYPLPVTCTGSSTITLELPELADVIKEGDQVRLTNLGEASVDIGFDGTGGDIINQLNPYYLVVSKSQGGRDMTLDRIPVDVDNNPIIGTFGVMKDAFKIFSHRILKYPLKKSEDFEITVRWSIIMN
jgi:hypothetical protein